MDSKIYGGSSPLYKVAEYSWPSVSTGPVSSGSTKHGWTVRANCTDFLPLPLPSLPRHMLFPLISIPILTSWILFRILVLNFHCFFSFLHMLPHTHFNKLVDCFQFPYILQQNSTYLSLTIRVLPQTVQCFQMGHCITRVEVLYS